MFGIAKKSRQDYLEDRLDELEKKLISAGALRQTLMLGFFKNNEAGNKLHYVSEKVVKLEKELVKAGAIDIIHVPAPLGFPGHAVFASTMLKKVLKKVEALADHLGFEFEWVEDRPRYVCREKPADPK